MQAGISGWPVIKAPLALLEIEVEMVLWDAIVAPQMPFGLVPEVLDPVDVISVFGKQFGMVDADMMEV